MSVETAPKISTSQDLIRTSAGKFKAQTIEEIASLSLETNRLADPYYYLVSKQGKLISPTARCNVTDVVATNTRVGQLEYQAFKGIESWAANNTEGVIAWISPPDSEFYPTSKVIISELQQRGDSKVLFNWAIVLDINEERCIKFAQDLQNFSTTRPLLSSLDVIRTTPLALKTSGNNWTYVLEELIENLNLESVRMGKDKKIKEKAVLQAQKIYEEVVLNMGMANMEIIAREVSNSGMIGRYRSSCPVAFGRFSAFEVFFNNALVIGKENCQKIRCGGKKEDGTDCGWEAKDEDAKKIQKGEMTCCPECGWKPGG